MSRIFTVMLSSDSQLKDKTKINKDFLILELRIENSERSVYKAKL